MAQDKNKQALPQTGPAVDDPNNAKNPKAQGQELKAGQPDAHERRQAARDNDEPQFFDTTIAKMVEREVEDEKTGEKHTEWVEVMSDNLYPGELTKAEYDEKQAEKNKKSDDESGKDSDKDSK